MMPLYDVIIIGGGPASIALGIELGMNNIKTLILERHEYPLLSPRAQSLNERTMELFMRWGLANTLREKAVLPDDYAKQGVWCSKLNGITYATASTEDQLKENVAAQKALRIPLYVTEEILRSRLADFNCVTFIKKHTVESIKIMDDRVQINAKNNDDGIIQTYDAKYAVGCDGADSITRESLNISLENLAPKRRVINLLFESPDLRQKITVEKGYIYYLLKNEINAIVGPVDIDAGIWYMQIFYMGNEQSIDDVDIDTLIENATGIQFTKKILNKHFWDMQIQLADHFSKGNRVFLVGDAAHVFAPTGGLGLNTAFGDVTNIGWKLAAAIYHHASADILKTYESERRPVVLRNLKAVEKNAHDIAMIQTQYPPEKEPKKFAEENIRIADQLIHSLGIALGYTYDHNEPPMKASEYIPTIKFGYFLPNAQIRHQSIYEKLSPIHWTLIVCGKEKVKYQYKTLKIYHVPEYTYPVRYILIRPDWHIAFCGNTISDADINTHFHL